MSKTQYTDWVEDLKAAGVFISENAESLIGNDSYLTDVTVSITLSPGEVTHVNVDRNYIPKQIVDNYNAT